MDNKKLFVFIKYFTLVFMIVGIIFGGKEFNAQNITLMLILIINHQLRTFSLNKYIHKIISFILEIVLVVICNFWISGYLFTYLILLAIDANVMFKKFLASIFNVVIILIGVYFSFNYSLNYKIMNLGVSIIIIAVFYFNKYENEKKIEAQDLYDRLRISEEKLKKANRDLEMYASSVEELTLLRERNRISREIHDSVGHSLSTMVIQLGAIEKIIRNAPEKAELLTKNLRKFTQKSLDEVRAAVRAIKPKEFEEYEGILSIEELISNFKKMANIDVRLAFTKEKWSLNSDQSFVLYRIVQEFLSNSARHGRASRVDVIMAFSEKNLLVTLKDNGQGCQSIIEGVGMKSMRERVKELGGYFEYKTAPYEGFTVKIELAKREKLKVYSGGENNG
ncbi:histidine kinase [Clostridium acetobutylicum]|nr:histidine kinase [Clostridium acetobutylicum]